MMALLGVVFLVALAGISVSAEPVPVFPEVAREFAGSRIVSGWEAEEGQLPYQLSMRMVNHEGTVNACGGTIIHAEWGLTAAHCTAARVTMVLRAGTVNLTRPGAIFETTTYFNHPLYDATRPSVVQPHDIALLKFNRVLTFNDNIQPIRQQSSQDKNRDYTGVRMVASGWGRTWTGSASPENLNWVYLSGVSNLVCFLAYGGSSIIQDSTICAAYYNVTSQSTCQGDSGGPLAITDDDGILTQVGVTSFVSGAGCHTEHPAGFIRSGHYHDWYLEVTGIDFDWEPKESEESGSEESSSSESESSESEEVTTTQAPEEETVGTVNPDSGEETEGTTQAPEEETVGTASPESGEEETEGTTQTPEEETVGTASPDSGEEETESTTQTPEEETMGTASPDSGEEETESTTQTPEEETMGTASPDSGEEETEGTTQAPEEETEGTTEAPEEEETVGTEGPDSGEETDSTTQAPEVETVGTTEAPEEETEVTTVEPEEETVGTTSAPESEEAEVEEAGNNFLKRYFPHFW